MVKHLAFFVLLVALTGPLMAQDTLPRFTVSTRDNKRVVISWSNNYKFVGQISIQRSIDSLKSFKTILSVPDPNVPQNGFADTKAPFPKMFYRLFIVLDSGKYIFTEAKRPFLDTSKIVPPPAAPPEKNNGNNKRVLIAENVSGKEADAIREKLTEIKPADTIATIAKPAPEKFITIKRRDSIITEISEKRFKAFRDSLVNKTRDTMVFRSADTILIKPFVPKEVYKPSVFVYTEKDGNIQIKLPEAETRHYSIKFFDDKNNPLFEIARVKESPLILDKANFLKSGWFRFELYEDGKLKEKNKFLIPKEF